VGRLWQVPLEVRERIVTMRAEGAGYAEIGLKCHVSAGTVRNVLAAAGCRGRVERSAVAGRLTLEDRIEIQRGIDRGESAAAIARRLGWHPSTITREIARHSRSGGAGYRPFVAHKASVRAQRRDHPRKLASNPVLLAIVVKWLEQLWSPKQIERRLRCEFPDQPEMRVSHETIYKTLYVQGRGELRRELARLCLRSGRAQRRPHEPRAAGARIIGMVNISERPAEVADRAVPGHWEGDQIIGKQQQSAVGTLVERSTRYVMLLHLKDRSAATMREAMAAKILELPEKLRKTITWDQGIEMAEHQRFTIDTGIQVYFCDPRSPWQRGSNENTNGLLRQYMPKGTDLSVYSEADLDAIADSLNGRPRQTLGWRTPHEALNATLDALDR
jgi:transposase, IS30 family